jgi:hypothetical protein
MSPSQACSDTVCQCTCIGIIFSKYSGTTESFNNTSEIPSPPAGTVGNPSPSKSKAVSASQPTCSAIYRFTGTYNRIRSVVWCTCMCSPKPRQTHHRQHRSNTSSRLLQHVLLLCSRATRLACVATRVRPACHVRTKATEFDWSETEEVHLKRIASVHQSWVLDDWEVDIRLQVFGNGWQGDVSGGQVDWRLHLPLFADTFPILRIEVWIKLTLPVNRHACESNCT